MKASGWTMAAIAGAAAALAIVLRSSPEFAVALSVIAILAASGLLLLILSDRAPASHRLPPEPFYPPDHLERAFHSGELGRQRVISAVEELQGRVFPHYRRLTPDEVRQLQHVSEEQFRGWVTRRLDAVERQT